MAPVGRDGDEGDELAGDLVDDDEAGVLAAGLAGDDGGCWDADEGGGDGGNGGADGEGQEGWVEEVRGSVPEEERGCAAVGSGAGF